jgi:hypothetical protein
MSSPDFWQKMVPIMYRISRYVEAKGTLSQGERARVLPGRTLIGPRMVSKHGSVSGSALRHDCATEISGWMVPDWRDAGR